ncbi:hypothetical protein ACHAXM_010098 [Skeletonema potamos]
MHVSVTTYLATPSCLYRHYCSNLLRGDKAAVFFRIEITATALFFLAKSSKAFSTHKITR